MDLSKYWKTIVDTLQDGLVVVDPWGNIRAVNPAAERMTGYREAELVGKSCRILNCTGCRIRGKGAGEKWCGLFSVGVMMDKKCLITQKNRRVLHIVKSASVLRDEQGRAIGAVETLRDVSEMVRKQREIDILRQTCNFNDGFYGLLGKTAVMRNLFEIIENVAQSEAPVLIQGESGSGKELIARAIHNAGPRKDKPYIKVNCAALNENLLESELFGHIKGAFTGAEQTRVGRFEAAHEGTLFLDEIGDIPLSTQVKLLRVIEEMHIERVGDHTPIPVNVRVVSATNKDLEALIESGRFRQDFYFRISVFPLTSPPLRERRDDIPLIVQNFIKQNAIKSGKKILGLTSEAMQKLLTYEWPGNVRELRNAIEYAFVLCPSGAIDVEHLPPKIAAGGPSPSAGDIAAAGDASERRALIEALRQTGGNQSQAARILGVSRVTVWKRINKYGIDPRRIGAGTAPAAQRP